jgi:SAM-dependent methyltransferase
MLKTYWTVRSFARILFQDYARSLYRDMTGWLRFWHDYEAYSKGASDGNKPQYKYLYPRLGDNTQTTPIDPVYYYQDAWAFEKIVQQNPPRHVDVGSHHKFVSLLSKVVPVTMVDIRPLPTSLASLEFRQGTILALPYEDGSVPSVSSICVIEHIGLGRYGDPIDPLGSEKALTELKRIVQPGGSLYVSVPIDDENRVYFNAHRAFREDYLASLFAPFEIIEKRYIYGIQFGDEQKAGFGVGSYYLRAPA